MHHASRHILAILGAVVAAPLAAQSVPTIDTEDARLGSIDVGSGRIHPVIAFDLRNGDFARGSYDDDRADLRRLPAHVQVGVGAEIHRNAAGKADTWIVLRSSNGFHAASTREQTSPRTWYESNNLVGVVLTPLAGLHAAAVYTIKASPNGVSDTTHEASLSLDWAASTGAGALRPSFVTTIRPRGNHGTFTLAGIEPQLPLGSTNNASKLSIPAAIGIGWHGFYGGRSGSRVFGHVGLALSRPFTIGSSRWAARAEVLALIRDDRLARLSAPNGETATVVPLATVGLVLAY